MGKLGKCLICERKICIIIEMNKLREKAEGVFAWAVEQRTDPYKGPWVRHSQQTARFCEEVARKMRENGCDIDVDMAYACGLLHDTGRYEAVDNGMHHVVAGYEVLNERGLTIPAEVALTHTFYGYGRVAYDEYWREMSADDIELITNFMTEHKTSDYDRLVQLADNMALTSGIVTIDARFVHVFTRHKREHAAEYLALLYELKNYFDQKCGENIYELFKDDIIRTTMLGLPGIYGEEEREMVIEDGKLNVRVKESS